MSSIPPSSSVRPQKMDANNGNLRASDNHYELNLSIKRKKEMQETRAQNIIFDEVRTFFRFSEISPL